ncbi:MAG: hypothetical protein R3D29_01695 [Nitratireductor sp.]
MLSPRWSVEKAAGKDANGSIDLIWINGENFASMKRQNLLLSPGWADKPPNWQYVDYANKPTITTDFTIPVDGLESPWGSAGWCSSMTRQGKAKCRILRRTGEWTKAHPRRFTYPAPLTSSARPS